MENENSNAQKKYFLGLDIGTDSVGWCVTDRDYNIIRKQGKHLWGSRLFTEASDASSRRAARESRRRLERRRWRILLLQDIFKEDINKVDPSFFDRLNNSALHEEDKPEAAKAPCLLFNGKGYTDKDYYKEYPTIYHLRKAMIEQPEKKFDIRMIYLAMEHMIKYRGNFLREGTMSNIGNDPQTLVDSFNKIDSLFDELSSADEDTPHSVPKFNCSLDMAKSLIDLFKSNAGKSLLLEQATDILKLAKGKIGINALLAIICGSTRRMKDIFPPDEDSDSDDETGDTKVDFTSSSFVDETMLQLPSLIGDNEAALIKAAKDIYDYRILANVLQGEKYVSEAMVNIYDTHKDQLKALKDLVKRYAPDKYNSFFRKVFDKNGKPLINYSTYIGFCRVKGKDVCVAKTTNKDSLYKEIKTMLPFDKVSDPTYIWKANGDKEALNKISNDMDSQKYLPRQNAKDNGVLPYQLNEIELIKIIDNQKQYYPFLGEMDKDFSNPKVQSYKIDSILKFKIPYYVGPLSNDVDPKTGKKIDTHWAIKSDSNTKITPWNFHDVIDKEKTEEAFIERMKNSCTYLIGEPTLPKYSLLYSEFTVLNEINNWLINGQPITIEDKDYLFNHVYLVTKKPSLTTIQAALKEKYKEKVELYTRTGKELDKNDIHANLSSWIDMSKPAAFGPNFFKDKEKYDLAEKIIYAITIFEDSKVVSERLDKLPLTPEQKRYFSSLTYSGWGKLSRKLIDGITIDKVDTSTGEVKPYSIIDLMRITTMNFMEIYETGADTNGFKKQVIALNQKDNPTVDDIIENEYTAPGMKRALRQTMKIVEELKHILHIDSFDSYFVECTRSPNDKNKKVRTQSRKSQLEQAYKAAKGFADEKLKANLETMTDDKLRSKKYFLYFMQLGRSVYSGEPIDIDEIDKNYDVDHIIPQAKVKDDSFTNTVLVERGLNNTKSDTYPIPTNCITDKGREWVTTLSKIPYGKTFLMPKEKMNRIMRPVTKPLTEDEEVGFVNRQLTITDQSVKAVCDVLTRTDQKAHIVYSKANLVSDFRKDFDFPKCRDVNDFHHANDAYLNIVVGNVYNKTFSSVFNKQLLERNKAYFESLKMNVENFFEHDHNIFLSDTKVWVAKHYDYDEKGNKIEDPNSKGTLDIVRKYMSHNDPMVTQMMFTQTGKQGFFNKISIHPVYDQGALMPLKATGPFASDGWEKKYGGYNDLTAPYFMLVRSEIVKGKNKGKHQYSLENIPAVYKSKFDDKEFVNNYLTKELGLVNPEVKLPKVLIRSIIEFHSKDENGKDIKCRIGITGKSTNRILGINMSELAIDKCHSNYIRAISKLLGTNLTANAIKPNLESYSNLETINSSNVEICKNKNMDLFDFLINKQLSKECYRLLPGYSSCIIDLKNSFTNFSSLSTINQCRVLSQIILLFQCKPRSIDLSLLGLSSHAAIIIPSKLLSPGDKIIITSVTGLSEKVLFTVPED